MQIKLLTPNSIMSKIYVQYYKYYMFTLNTHVMLFRIYQLIACKFSNYFEAWPFDLLSLFKKKWYSKIHLDLELTIHFLFVLFSSNERDRFLWSTTDCCRYANSLCWGRCRTVIVGDLPYAEDSSGITYRLPFCLGIPFNLNWCTEQITAAHFLWQVRTKIFLWQEHQGRYKML